VLGGEDDGFGSHVSEASSLRNVLGEGKKRRTKLVGEKVLRTLLVRHNYNNLISPLIISN
jgi:hypothetical protein